MSGSSRATLEMAQQLAIIQAAGETIRANGPTALSIGTISASAMVAVDLFGDPFEGDVDELRRRGAVQAFRQSAQRALIPDLERHLLAALELHHRPPDPTSRSAAGATDLARCLVALAGLVSQGRNSPRLGPELVRRVEAYGRHTREVLAAPEPADLPLLAANHRVLDEMLETLQLLNDPASAAAIRQHARILARSALARVAATLEDFLQHATLDTRFDMATVLAATDDLLIVARKVIDGVGEEYDPIAERYADNLGMETLRRFAAAILAIEQQTLRQCVVAVGQAQVSAEVLASSLLMLVKLHGLGRAILEGCRAGTVAVGAARAVERAEQLLRPKAMVQGVEFMAQQMDRLLAERVRDASEAAIRRDAYAAAFEDFKARTGLLHAR